MSPSKIILYFILALALGRGIIYASIVPPWQAPDEPPHFERARAALTAAEWTSTAENGPEWYGELARSLFTFDLFDFLDTRRLTYSPDAPLNRYIALYQEAYNGLYGSRVTYALIGWPLFLARQQDITLQLYLVRLNTVLMNVGIILLAYLLTKTIFPHEPFLYLGVPVLILFNPQHTHMLSTVNNGNLAELLALAALYVLVRGMLQGFSWLNILLVLVFSLAAMWTKATAYFLPFAIGSAALFYLWRYRRHWRWWFLPAGVFLVGLTYYFAPERLKLLIPGAWKTLQAQGFYLDPIVPQDLFRSFWAMPGWTIFYVHPRWYQLLALGCILAFVGLGMFLMTRWRSLWVGKFQAKAQTLMVLAVATIMAIGILLAWNGITHSIVYRQGRSIYPVLVPISIFLLLGWRQLIPKNWRKIGLLAVTLAFFSFDTMVLFHYLIPFFYSRY